MNPLSSKVHFLAHTRQTKRRREQNRSNRKSTRTSTNERQVSRMRRRYSALSKRAILVPRAHDPSGLWQGSRALACVSQKTRKLLGPEDFSGLFSDEFLGSRKAFLNAPENTPDSHPSFSGCFPGFAARA